MSHEDLAPPLVQRPKRRRWEYREFSMYLNDMDRLNAYGDDGWEAVGVLHRGSAGSADYLLLKRELP